MDQNRDPRRGSEEDPLEGEATARVLDQQGTGSNLIFALTEGRLHLVRIRPHHGVSVDLGSVIHIAAGPERTEVQEVLGTMRYRDLTPTAHGQLHQSICDVIQHRPEAYLGFYNRAGNLSLKMHAFQLLPGVGNKKAVDMVEKRGRAGWDDFTALDEAVALDCVDLLAQRLSQEIADPRLEPRLVDLLLRQE